LVCTCDRPASLRALLDRLELIRRGSAPSDFACVVVDDSETGSAGPVVDAWLTGRDRLPVTYVPLGSRNISRARNVAADTASEDEWWFLLDDDCVPDPGWMSGLMAAQQATGADVVCGPVTYVPTGAAPDWLTEQGFLDVNHYSEGAEPEFGALNNALIRAAWWRGHPEVRFREEFGTRGGEDLVFMIEARRAGARVRWTERAGVREDLPTSRASLRYQLRRRLWTGNVNAGIDLECAVRSRRRLLARSALKTGHLTRDVVRGLGRRRLEGRRRLGQAAFVLGMVLATVGVNLQHR
jgi:glycosyltransferase involved in cell wall biosynthesis